MIGYYEEALHTPAEVTLLSVWLPLAESTTPLREYRYSITMGKKFRLMTSSMMADGMPRSLACLMPKTENSIPTASARLGAATPDMIADRSRIRGLIVIAHGFTDGSLSLAHAAERLAAHGFVVAAPSFSDSQNNDTPSPMEHGRRYAVDQTALRVVTMEACVDKMKSTFAAALNGLPTGLIGYSFGADTIRQMSLTCPRLYVGGPGWRDVMVGEDRPIPTRPPPGGPSVQLAASEDGLMRLMKLSLDNSSLLTGFGCPDERRVVHSVDELVAKAGERECHLRLSMVDVQQHGDFKYPPYAESERLGWTRALCGLNPFNPCGKPTDPQVKQERADKAADAMIRWLLVVMSPVDA